MNNVKEKVIEAYFKKKAEKHKCFVAKFTSPGFSGVPDRVIIRDGLVYFVELKRPKGSLEKRQILVHKAMQKKGANISVLNTNEKIDIFFDTNYPI